MKSSWNDWWRSMCLYATENGTEVFISTPDDDKFTHQTDDGEGELNPISINYIDYSRRTKANFVMFFVLGRNVITWV